MISALLRRSPESMCVQFVKKMGIVTDKSHVMVQPTIIVMKNAPDGKHTVPATIQDKLNVGWLVKYFLIFDDNQVCIRQQVNQATARVGLMVCVRPSCLLLHNGDLGVVPRCFSCLAPDACRKVYVTPVHQPSHADADH